MWGYSNGLRLEQGRCPRAVNQGLSLISGNSTGVWSSRRQFFFTVVLIGLFPGLFCFMLFLCLLDYPITILHLTT
jgi:hypothetical protein